MRAVQKVFNTSGSYSLAELILVWPGWFICSSIRNWVAYANEANIVNKHSPIQSLKMPVDNLVFAGNLTSGLEANSSQLATD